MHNLKVIFGTREKTYFCIILMYEDIVLDLVVNIFEAKIWVQIDWSESE